MLPNKNIESAREEGLYYPTRVQRASVYIRLALIELTSENFDNAKTNFQNAIALGSFNLVHKELVNFLAPAEKNIHLGQSAVEQADINQAEFYFNEAEKHFDKAMRIFPVATGINHRLANFYITRAQAAMHYKNFLGAETYFERARSMGLDNVDVKFNLAKALFSSGKFAQACKMCKELLKSLSGAHSNPKKEIQALYVDSLKASAAVKWKFQYFDEAIKLYRKAFKLDESCHDLLVTQIKAYTDQFIAKLLVDKDFQEAKDQKQYLFNTIKQISIPFLVPYLWRLSLRKESALGEIFWAARGMTMPSLISGTLAKIVAELNDYEKKGEELAGKKNPVYSFHTRFQLDPTNENLYRSRANSAIDKNNHLSAIADFSRLIVLYPTHQLYHSRGKCYVELGEKENALADFYKAIELGSDDKSVYTDHLQLLKSLERKSESQLIESLMDIVFNEELETKKDKKRFVFNKVKQLPSKQALPLLQWIQNKQTILGAILWEKETGLFSHQSSLEHGILKEIVDEIARLQENLIQEASTNSIDQFEIECDESKSVESTTPKKKSSYFGSGITLVFGNKVQVPNDKVVPAKKATSAIPGLRNSNDDL